MARRETAAMRDFDPAYDRSGSKPAADSALASGLLYLSHPTLAARVSTSGSCQEETFRGSAGALRSRSPTPLTAMWNLSRMPCGPRTGEHTLFDRLRRREFITLFGGGGGGPFG